MGVKGRTKGATLRVKDTSVLIWGQREDADGNPTEEYLIFRVDEHGRVMNYDHPDPVNLQLFTAQVLDADPTEVNSQADGDLAEAIDCSTYRNFSVELTILSANSPTDIEFFVEFSNNGGADWAHHAQGLFASLVYSDLSVATVVRETFTGLVVGDMFRLRVVATGTDGTDTFTFSALVRFWR
jgi:hypothetical protein